MAVALLEEPGFPPHIHQPAPPEVLNSVRSCRLTGTGIDFTDAVSGRPPRSVGRGKDVSVLVAEEDRGTAKKRRDRQTVTRATEALAFRPGFRFCFLYPEASSGRATPPDVVQRSATGVSLLGWDRRVAIWRLRAVMQTAVVGVMSVGRFSRRRAGP